VLVLDRSRFDRELAKMASSAGADIEVGQRVAKHVEENGSVKVETEASAQTSRWMVNAAGYSTLPRGKKSTLQAAKFEVNGDWFDRDTVEIYFDQQKAPGYFTWVIPIHFDTAKVGVAGLGVHQFKVLDEFVKARGGVAVKKTAAQIVVGGPIERFVSGRVVSVGDAAGQAKPTTGGGIYSGGVGGVLAGRYIAKSLSSGEPSKVEGYEQAWRNLFGREFGLLLRLRRILDRLDNDKIDRMFKALASSDILGKISVESDFDHHSVAFLKALGLRNIFQIASIVAGDLLDSLRPLLRRSER
jgi:flavin-dependent dehydrogenase